MRRILVIKLGALGDFFLAASAFAAIRHAAPGAEITLLTTAPFISLARRAPWFDRVALDPRAPWWNLLALSRLSRALRGFSFIYDLQTSRRSTLYFRLAGGSPWSGIARGASHRDRNPLRNGMHTLERQRSQLEAAGIHEFPAPDFSWFARSGRRFSLLAPYALLVPGAAAHRPAKRWAAERFAALARHLSTTGLVPVLIGGTAERGLGPAIRALAPDVVDLIGATELIDLGRLAADAALAVGNDTGPMHIAAALGCPALVLFSAESDPALTAPRTPDGGWATVLRVENLADLSVDRVVAALPSPHRRGRAEEKLLPCPPSP